MLPTPPPVSDDDDEQCRRYEQRLNDGYELLEKRREAGLDVSKLEDFWIELCQEYRERYKDDPD